MRWSVFGVMACVGLLAARDMSPRSSYGFRLPECDAEAGLVVYKTKQCASCHIIEARPELRDGIEPELDVVIGGLQTRIATHGELVSAVINPSHKLARGYGGDAYRDDNGRSVMRNYNDEMTVAELIDLVAFLQGEYEEFPDY